MKPQRHHKFIILSVLPSALTFLLLIGIFAYLQYRDMENDFTSRGLNIAQQLRGASEFALNNDKNSLPTLLQEITKENSNIVNVSVFNANKQLSHYRGPTSLKPTLKNIPFTHSDQVQITKANAANEFLFSLPLLNENHEQSRISGWVVVGMSHTGTTLSEYQMVIILGFIACIGLFLQGLFLNRMRGTLFAPIKQLNSLITKYKKGQYDAHIAKREDDNFSQLRENINELGRTLKSSHQKMKKDVEEATSKLKGNLNTIETQNAELEVARKEALQASRVKSEFITNISHEIRTPLNGIIGFTNLLSETELSAHQMDYLTTVQRSSNNLLAIINDILDFSKLESGKLKLENVPMDIRVCIEEVLTILAPNALKKQLETVLMIYSDVPTRLIGDPVRFKQIMTNLIGNAIKFTYEGSIVIRVMLEKELGKQVNVRITIADTGIGISAEEQQRLFKAFSNVDTAINRKFDGTGLGLVISKRLVKQMGGDIGLESTPSKGSTFWLSFPSKKINDRPTKDYSHLEGTKVLLSELHPTTQLSLSHQLATWNTEIHTATHSELILEQIDNAKRDGQPFQLLVIGMQQKESISDFIEQRFEQVRQSFSGPILVLANTTEPSSFNQLLSHGANACIPKPVRYDKFYNELHAMLFPRNLNGLNHTLEDNDGDNSSPQPRGANNNHNLPAPKVLAVDDNPANLKLIALLLEQMDIDVSLAKNGKEAVKAATEENFDLILMDIQMPEMDGIEAASRIRANSPTDTHTPIIALTAHAMTDEHQAFLEAGLDDCISKPIDAQQLKRHLSKWLQAEKNQPHGENTRMINSNTDSSPTQAHGDENTIANNHQPAVDWGLCLKLVGGKVDIAHDMLAMLVDTLPEEREKIVQAYNNNDFKLLQEYIHKLHGATCYCGVPKLKQVTSRFETALKTNDTKQYRELSSDLDKEIQQVLEQAENFI